MTTPHAPHGRDLLNRPTELPVDPAVARLEAGEDPRAVVADVPTSSAGWAQLSSAALADDPVAAYAFARTGYHRGLDSLRKAGWKGTGPVPAATPRTSASCGRSPHCATPPRRSVRRPRSSG